MIFRKITTLDIDASLEFLDVEHIVNHHYSGGFFTKNYIKPTSVQRLFLNGKSYHPRSVFKSIVFGESTRLRRLCERNVDYRDAITALQQKCYKSGINKSLVDGMIQITIDWTERFAPKVPKDKCYDNTRPSVWATSFPGIFKLSKRDRDLNPTALLAYKRPGTLAAQLTNYKSLAHGVENKIPGKSATCGRCKLCGKYGSKTMVVETTSVQSKSGDIFYLRKYLNCKDHGIYVATCRVCSSQYVGQTMTSFAERWQSHRSAWKSGVVEMDDRAALRVHFFRQHPDKKHFELPDAFSVTFIDKPRMPKDLDVLESIWISKLCANININRTILPKYR